MTSQSPSCIDRVFRRRVGFTTTELLVVIGLIVLLLAIILPAVRSVRAQAIMSQSMSNLSQTASFMQLYAKDNREVIVPSRFDYSDDRVFSYKGRVASDPGIPEDQRHRGTWADILWTVNDLGGVSDVKGRQVLIDNQTIEIGHDYRTKAPDRLVYEIRNNWTDNPFRSTARNTRHFSRVDSDSGPGDFDHIVQERVDEMGLPGYFAANDFFDARPTNDQPTGNWYTTGQIRSPERSMYLVDSFAGPVISPTPPPFNTQKDSAGVLTQEVDFRYNGVALMLFLDGSVRPQNRWENICELECHRDPADPDFDCECDDSDYANRGIRISNLTSR